MSPNAAKTMIPTATNPNPAKAVVITDVCPVPTAAFVQLICADVLIAEVLKLSTQPVGVHGVTPSQVPTQSLLKVVAKLVDGKAPLTCPKTKYPTITTIPIPIAVIATAINMLSTSIDFTINAINTLLIYIYNCLFIFQKYI